MPLHLFFGPTRFGTEFVYTVIIAFLCFLIYYKTREIYDLTKHKGIQYFRNTFLFFGLAYVSRFILHILLFAGISFDIYLPRRFVLPLIMVPVGYLSTMALFYLAYSLVWRKVQNRYFLIFSNLIAILLAIVAFVSKSPFMVSILQLVLVLFIAIVSFSHHGKRKIVTQTRVMYLLVLLFWIINLIVLGPRRIFAFEIKIALQVLSIILFLMIFYKVVKWIR